jgi:hypothetical protein
MLMVRGVDLPPKTCHNTFVETTTPNVKTSTKFVIIKECGNWIKTAKEVQKPINSWNAIVKMIDDIFDQSMDDYAILHKPFNLLLM